MSPESKRTLVVSVGVSVALAILAVVWWVNGAEQEDAWLYLSAAVVVILGAWSAYPKKK